MWKLFAGKKKSAKLTKQNHIIYMALITVGVLLIAAASIKLVAGERGYSSAREEYDELSGNYPDISSYFASATQEQLMQNGEDIGTAPGPGADQLPSPESALKTDNSPGADEANPLAELYAINSDFIGWISIGDVISYPIVQGSDNSYYLDRTFTKKKNPAGAIFMDSRNELGFDEPVCILYGHNMKDGSMFARLHDYQFKEFMDEHPIITIVTLGGKTLTYRVFAARLTDITNKAYELEYKTAAQAAKALPKAPSDASSFLLLSTCWGAAGGDERFLVYAALTRTSRN